MKALLFVGLLVIVLVMFSGMFMNVQEGYQCSWNCKKGYRTLHAARYAFGYGNISLQAIKDDINKVGNLAPVLKGMAATIQDIINESNGITSETKLYDAMNHIISNNSGINTEDGLNTTDKKWKLP